MSTIEEAADYLYHYFDVAGVHVNGDTRAELERCIELIVQAAIERIRQSAA